MKIRILKELISRMLQVICNQYELYDGDYDVEVRFDDDFSFMME